MDKPYFFAATFKTRPSPKLKTSQPLYNFPNDLATPLQLFKRPRNHKPNLYNFSKKTATPLQL